MLFFDLRAILFFFLLILIVATWSAVWLDRRLHSRAPGKPPVLQESYALLEPAPLGILVLEGQTCCFANRQARDLFALSPPPCVLPDADWARLLHEDCATARQEAGRLGCYRSTLLPNDRFVRWWVAPWAEQDVVLVLDDTAGHRSEQAARLLLNDLSHELRTPIATLLTHLQVLQLSTISDATRQQSLHLMQQEARRMSGLVHDLLELGRLETTAELEQRPLDLLPLIEEAIRQMTPQAAERGIAISLQTSTPLPRVAGDANRLKQVLINLLDNAIKYSRPGDCVGVSLQCDQSQLVCAICDTGPGIPAEHLPHLTQRFYRVASEASEGSGLGLAIVQEILHRHQSKLEIESRSDGEATGTCVRFALPVLD
jgi:two-component system, OmpR family, phosphate regulon sensor histidine kinase PhoR